jgi:hypothetical protein
MTKRVRTRFRVSEYASGKPFVVLEPLSGDELEMSCCVLSGIT